MYNLGKLQTHVCFQSEIDLLTINNVLYTLVLKETLTMEEVLLRFPHLGESIFDQLDNASFAKCRIVSKAWISFLEPELYPFRIIKNEPKLHKKTRYKLKKRRGNKRKSKNTVSLAPSNKLLKKILRENPEDTPMCFAIKVHECVSGKSWNWQSPLHAAAERGYLSVYQLISKIHPNNNSFDTDLTPLHNAAQKRSFFNVQTNY